jgi:pimeloyl-ACP methyl ester carboxylesterase
VQTTGSIDVGAVRLTYRVWGDEGAPPMVLLHGLTASGANWAPVAPVLASRYRVHAPDLRGHGTSDWPGEYSFDALVADVVGFLDALALPRVVLVGHSMGGVVAHLLASRYPDRVAALVLEDPPPPVPLHRPVPTEAPKGTPVYDFAARLAVLRQVNAPDPAWAAGIADTTAPTLVIAGGPGSHLPQEEIAAMAGRFPHGRLVTIAAGHLVHTLRPAEFVAEVFTFLDATP